MFKKNILHIGLLLSSFSPFSIQPKQTILDTEFSEDDLHDVLHDAIHEQNLQNKSVLKKEKGLTREAGQNVKDSGLSDVINLAPGLNPRNFLHVASEDIKVELDGKLRFDSSFADRTQWINKDNGTLDTIFVPGKTTFDLGFGISYGENKYDRDVLEIGIDLRNHATWGKPDEVTVTSKTSIKDGDYVFGEHNHLIGVPLLYVRGFDITIEPGLLFSKQSTDAHHIKLGFFPFEVGRGISLGAAYAVTPDFITYNPGDIIQAFAPGFMLYGELGCRKYLSYKIYVGLLKNLMGSFKDINDPIRYHEYGKFYTPQRDFGVSNIVNAYQFDLKIPTWNENVKLMVSPYSVFSHDGEEIVDFLGDAYANMATFGCNLSTEVEGLEFNVEFAKNYGSQIVSGIDRNSLTREQRIVTTSNATGNQDTKDSHSVLINSDVNYMSTSYGTDINGKNAVYLNGGSDRQNAILTQTQSMNNNNEMFTYNQKNSDNSISKISLQNSADRYRDPYVNNLRGWMMVSDISYKLNYNDSNIKFSGAFGIASGDENPNKSLLSKNDFAQNTTYEGFIGLQEVYTGKAVRSVFMMSGLGKVPRVLSIPALEDQTNAKNLGYPSRISRFTNLIYGGTSCDITFDTSVYGFRVNPNFLVYFQETPPAIHDTTITQAVGKQLINNYLGSEVNLFLEMNSHTIDGLKLFGTGTVFIPGSYYSDLKGIPLDKKQQAYINSMKSSIPTAEKVCLVGDDTAFAINIGMEYKF